MTTTTDRELLAARQLIRLLRDALMACGEHQADCERGIIAGHDCACGLDLAIQLACEVEPPEPPPARTPADIEAWVAARAAESRAARLRIFGPTEGHL